MDFPSFVTDLLAGSPLAWTEAVGLGAVAFVGSAFVASLWVRLVLRMLGRPLPRAAWATPRPLRRPQPFRPVLVPTSSSVLSYPPPRGERREGV